MHREGLWTALEALRKGWGDVVKFAFRVGTEG